MPALTKTQLDHAKAKVAALVTARMAAFTGAAGPKPKVPQYTPEERRAMILDGRATIKQELDFENTCNYASIASRFNFPLTGAMVSAQLAADAWQKAHDDEHAKVCAIKERVIDELVMSPDGMAALTKIAEAFAS